MYRAHKIWKAEHNGVSTRSSDNSKGAEVLFGELQSWPRSSEVLGLYIDLVSNIDFWSREVLGISWTLVVILGSLHLGAEVLM